MKIKKQIEVAGGGKIDYSVNKSKKARRVKLAVCCDGSVAVTIPHHFNEGIADRFVKEKMDWIMEKISHFERFDKIIIPQMSKKDYGEYKDKALALVNERISHFNQMYGFSFNDISIKNHKARWGSCSSSNNLNFNYRIVFLPLKLADYIVVHELCHLGELNHSKDFWSLVAKALPHHKDLRKELRMIRLI